MELHKLQLLQKRILLERAQFEDFYAGPADQGTEIAVVPFEQFIAPPNYEELVEIAPDKGRHSSAGLRSMYAQRGVEEAAGCQPRPDFTGSAVKFPRLK